ncbi:hypothetical protein K438DRAFT_2020894 [Mycena galopus ATCC 62051]|nr:hypothetical protein K438DRAFT_2020894 [Mycena galopus ATCC 62051]
MLAHLLLASILFTAPFLTVSTPFKGNVRQTDASCTNQCATYQNGENACNNTVVNDAATCYNCLIQTSQITQDSAQETLNEFVQECAEIGQPVTNVTLSGNSALPAGSGSAPPPTTTKATSTKTDTAEDSSTTDPAEDPSTTDAAGDSASVSANATDSASASGASGGSASSAELVKARSASVLTWSLVVVSVVTLCAA